MLLYINTVLLSCKTEELLNDDQEMRTLAWQLLSPRYLRFQRSHLPHRGPSGQENANGLTSWAFRSFRELSSGSPF